MPKLWTDTVEAHRRGVREAILDATWALVNERGLAAVRMSEIAERAGIGRATLYKYFPDVETILAAWHHRQIARQIDYLVDMRDRATDSTQRLAAVFEAYARHQLERAHHRRHDPHGSELAIVLHRADAQVAAAQEQLHAVIRDFLQDAAQAGDIRTDIAPGELATYCLHALAGADTLSDAAAVGRLVAVILDGLRPPR
jgi:AcrR family transcriptional regulator